MSKESLFWRFVVWLRDVDEVRESIWSVSGRRRGAFTVTVLVSLGAGFYSYWDVDKSDLENFSSIGFSSVLFVFFLFEAVDIMGYLTQKAAESLLRAKARIEAQREQRVQEVKDAYERGRRDMKAELSGEPPPER